MAIYKQIKTEEEKKQQPQAQQQTKVGNAAQAQQRAAAAYQPAAQNWQQPQSQQYQTAQGQQHQAAQAGGNVAAAQQLLEQLSAQKPGAYQSQWSEKLNGILDKITNRKPFQYDVNADALYQMYKDQYVQQGKMAMQDTMGQAATMTGGYGNSYAQGVGQQAYQGYLQQLTGKIPELARQAQDQYNQEGQELYNLYSLMGSQENQDYSRYRDDMGQWNTDMDRLYNQYLNERNFQYQQGRDQVSDSRYDQEWQYQQNRDQVADARYDREFAYQQDRDQVADARYDREFQYQQGRDQVADARYDREFQYQQNRDQVSDARYDQEWQYQQNRDQVSDSRYDQEWQYQQEKNNQSLAQAQVDYLLSLGVKPNDELMKAAGYDSQYANEAMARAKAAQNAGRSSGYSGGGGNESGGNESGGYQWSGEGEPTLEEMLLDMAAQNRPNEELKKVILAASADGIIDRDDEQAWAKSFGVIGANPTYKAPNTRSKFDEALKAEAEKTATQKARGQGAPSLEEMWIWW